MSDNDDKLRARLAAFEEELAQDPRSLVFIPYAEDHNRQGNFEEAAAIAQKGLVYHPDSSAGRLALALAEAGRNNVRGALEQIKRALLIDPENSRALGLMGRILLQKGLARRAVQFLSHAVKLAPDEVEYVELLKKARVAAETEAPAPPALPDVPRDSTSPWSSLEDASDSGGLRPSDSEHTVFDPDALKQMRFKSKRANGGLDLALAQLGDDIGTEEPTRFDGMIRRATVSARPDLPAPKMERSDPGSPAADPPVPRDEGAEVKSGKNGTRRGQPAEAPASGKKPKVGGSAAEFSLMMRSLREGVANGRASAEVLPSPANPSLRARGTPPPVPPEADPASSSSANGEVAAKGGEPAAKKSGRNGVKERGEGVKESRVAGVKGEAAEAVIGPAEGSVRPAGKANVEAEAPPRPAKAGAGADALARSVGTRMVDEALWALLGGKADVAPVPAVEREKKPKESEKDPAVEAREKKPASPKADRGPQPMVVRTSEQFGTVFKGVVLTVIAIVCAWLGYAMAVDTGGAAPETMGEEIKGIASDLERGSLARLIMAEEQALTLMPTMPNASDLLTAALAEDYARRWASFGHDPEMLAKAREKIDALRDSDPTVELLAARVTVATSAADRAALLKLLDASAKRFPESPKVLVLRARVREADGKLTAAEDDLYAARAINPQHRTTLLDLARLHARQGRYAAAFSYYDLLESLYPDDVEVAIDRYVLGQVSGRDAAINAAATVLAGLVRDVYPEVARDEAGRVALAFAVPMLARGDVTAGLEELGKADGAFAHSAEFKAALAGTYLAVGLWDRAKKQYERALQIEPENAALRLGIARASFGERAGLKAKEDRPASKDKGKSSGGASWSNGVAMLPYATLRFQAGRFSLIEIEPNREIFPETAYSLARARARNAAGLRDGLEAANLAALANDKVKKGTLDEAQKLLEEAQKLQDGPTVRLAMGRLALAKSDPQGAERAFKKALELDKNFVPARLGLASVLAERKDFNGAMSAIEAIEKSDVVVPQAALQLARYRIQKNEWEKAQMTLQGAVESLPRDPAPLLMLAEVQSHLRRFDDAVESYRKVQKIAPKLAERAPEKMSTLQLLYFGRLELDRDESKGMAMLKQCAKRSDAPPVVHFFMGKTLMKKKSTKKQGKRELEEFLSDVRSGEAADEARRLLR